MTGTETPKERIQRLRELDRERDHDFLLSREWNDRDAKYFFEVFNELPWLLRVCEAAVEAHGAWQARLVKPPELPNIGVSLRPLWAAIEDTEGGAA